MNEISTLWYHIDAVKDGGMHWLHKYRNFIIFYLNSQAEQQVVCHRVDFKKLNESFISDCFLPPYFGINDTNYWYSFTFASIEIISANWFKEKDD